MSGDGPIALVTGGAGSGIGSGVCAVLAENGWHVVVADFDLDSARDVAAGIEEAGGRATGVEIDVADEDSVRDAVAFVATELGPVRALTNSAGIGMVKPIANVTPAEWDRLHSVDLRGAFLMSRAVIPGMIAANGGAIVCIGSVQALGPHVGYSTYSAAKAGMVGLTKGIAADYGPDGIRSNIVHPGLVDSPQNRELIAQWGDPNLWMERYVKSRQMIPRLIEPREIGKAVAYLVSDAAASITAAELVVDGGSSAMPFDRDEV